MAKVTLPPDPWQNVLSLHDLRADELISGLQKCLRRGLTERALLIAYEMCVTSAEFEEHLWTRLSVISVEDVGRPMTAPKAVSVGPSVAGDCTDRSGPRRPCRSTTTRTPHPAPAA